MLLSACIIARDEEHSLPRCLASVTGLVDEVVVYDTGSVDATAAVAEAAGARVVRGSWPGGFAEARNAAAAHCRGDWVLSVDADEEAAPVLDPASLRAQLPAVPEDVDALQVSIDNVGASGPGSVYSHVAERLFRRERCRWRGRLHEQLVAVEGAGLAASRYLSGLRLRHHGYVPDPDVARAKADRNLQLARAEVEDPSFDDRGIALVWLGRALWAAGRLDEALPALLDGSRVTTNATARRQGLAGAARVALALGRTEVAADAVAALRSASATPVAADVLQAGVHLAEERWGAALDLLDTVTATVRDDDGYEHSPRSTVQWRAAALLGAGRPGEAADTLLGPLQDEGVLVADLDLLVTALDQAGRPLDEVVAAAPAEAVATLAAGATRLRADRSHELLEALWHRWGNEEVRRQGSPGLAVLAGAALGARLLPAEQSTVWSARLRSAGLAELCPLAALARDGTAPPLRRLQAALAAGRVGDGETVAMAAQLAALLPPGMLDGLAVPPDILASAEALRVAGTPALRVPVVSVDGRPGGPDEPRVSPVVSLVLVTTGEAARVLGCLQALAATLPDDLTFEVVVVLAGADATTRRLVGDLGGDVVVVDGALAVGRSRARNLGLAASAGDVVCFVDPAARTEPGWLPPLVADLAADPNLGCVGAAWRTAAGDLVAGGAIGVEEAAGPAAGLARRPWSGSGRPEPDVTWQQVDEVGAGERAAAAVLPVDVVPGHVLAVRRSAIERVGAFDEGYWNGGEVADLCTRLAADGWTVACDPASVAGDDTGTHPATTLWAEQDPARVPLVVAAGPRWQWCDNRERFTRRWLVSSLVP